MVVMVVVMVMVASENLLANRPIVLLLSGNDEHRRAKFVLTLDRFIDVGEF
jgi:hypothetical protein